MEHASIAGSFHDYFRLVLADSSDLRARAYKLRYEVYCREFGFESEEHCPNQQERDDYDDQSIHCLLMHQATGRTAGCVRLVLADPRDLAAPLPFERFCSASLDPNSIDTAQLSRTRMGEISRLAVLAGFRRRPNEDRSPSGATDDYVISNNERRHFPYISLGLHLAAASIGLLSGLDGVFAMMELRLARHLSHYGIKFVQVGNVVEYHGPRAPFYINRAGLMDNLRPEVRELLDAITADLDVPVKRARLRVVQ